MRPRASLPMRRFLFVSVLAIIVYHSAARSLWAAEGGGLGIRQILEDGGVISYVIIALSIAMIALIVEHVLSFRRSSMMPPGLAETAHQLIMQGQFKKAQETCRAEPSFLGHVLDAGLSEVSLGYSAVEKSMEDASTEQSARLFRKIEYLSVIGTLAPMIGLLGTVWGLMLAFEQFEAKTNPHIAELAPGIRKAMVTTLMGLTVAVPALASFAFFRNRIDELVAESSLTAEQVFSDFKRAVAAKRRAAAKERPASEDRGQKSEVRGQRSES